ncbi:MAG: hypothetical protein ACSHYB_04505 [Roseibacillus sp.]
MVKNAKLLTKCDILWFYTVMFQSVAPRPGKIAFQIEPFPIPEFQVLPEASKVTTLPVAEPVAVTTESEAPAVEDTAPLVSPFLMATEMEEDAIVVNEVEVPEAVSPSIFDEVMPEQEPVQTIQEVERLEEEAPVGKIVEAELVEPAETIVDSHPIVQVQEEVEEPSTKLEVFSEPVQTERPNPFQKLEAVEEVVESVPEEVVAGEAQPSVVTSWQPPAPSDKRKNSKFGGLFRQ